LIEPVTTGDLSALLDGAATLRRAGNRVAAIATLLSAVGVAPDDRTAHRRLAAAYAVAGDRDSARAEYARFIARLESRGSFDAAVLERGYAATLLAEFAPRTLALPARVEHHRSPRFNHAQSSALRRVAVAAVAIAATFGAMFIAGAQIFASAGPL
jgi:tetratricopeptide (TPR) repeat protein